MRSVLGATLQVGVDSSTRNYVCFTLVLPRCSAECQGSSNSSSGGRFLQERVSAHHEVSVHLIESEICTRFEMDYLLATLKKPYVTILDGVTSM